MVGALVAGVVLAPFFLMLAGIFWDVLQTYLDEWDENKKH